MEIRRLPWRLRDEHGFTAVGMAIALLISLALLFTAAQVYRVNSAAAEIQDVADAVALAAENEVAEFMIAVRVCDAVLLSLSLLAVGIFGVAAVVSCIPGVNASLGPGLVDAGMNVVKARGSFATKAADGLNALQQALPFLAAANASMVAAANNTTGASPASYFGVAMLTPLKGKPIAVKLDTQTEALADAVQEEVGDLRDAADEAERAAQEAQRAKEIGYRSDCDPEQQHSMFERARHLALLSGSKNPQVTSVDLWHFRMALDRAKAYYAARLAAERPENDSLEERINSALRKTAFRFAVQEMGRGYVHETESSFEAYFPRLPRNTEEMKETSLYTQVLYPISVEQGRACMHADAICPKASGSSQRGSLRQLDEGAYDLCPVCKFRASSVGQIFKMTSEVDSGFEKHYLIVAEAAEAYEQARKTSDEKTGSTKEIGKRLLDRIGNALEGLRAGRLTAAPPGYLGAIACVVNTRQVQADSLMSSTLVQGTKTLGLRAAVSGATLVDDSASDGNSVISDIMRGLVDDPNGDSNALVDGAHVVLRCWSWLLTSYSSGIEGLIGGVKEIIGDIPLVGLTGLGSWVSQKLQDTLKMSGLYPADMDALKPVLVNTAHIVAKGDDPFSVQYRSIQDLALRASSSTVDPFATLLEKIDDGALELLKKMNDGIQVAAIDVPILGNIPVTIALPEALTGQARGFVAQCLDAVRSAVGEIRSSQVWK